MPPAAGLAPWEAAWLGAVVAAGVEHAATARTAIPARAPSRPIRVWFKIAPPLRDSLLTTSDRGGRGWPSPASAVDGRRGLVSKRGDDDREDQQRPEGDALDLHGHASEPQRVLHHGHDE